MRIAFVTDEHPLTHPRSGGLATYVGRMTRLLARYGHDVQVFVPAAETRSVEDQGVMVHKIGPSKTALHWLADRAGMSHRLRKAEFDRLLNELGCSLNLARALRRVERANGSFDWVQSGDYNFRGLFVSARGRPHLVRCSWARDLFESVDGISHYPFPRMAAWFERLAIRRASAAYAPSRLVSDYYRREFGLPVGVLRPPAAPSRDAGINVPPQFTEPYLVHFGQMCQRKGTDYVLQAAALLSDEARPVRIFLAGVDASGITSSTRLQIGTQYLGPLERSAMVQLVSGACAAVLPSRVDNLPNTAIESLAIGTPVVTMESSSIDELIEPNFNGWVVPQGDVRALADAMHTAWTAGKSSFKGSLGVGPVFNDMKPDQAVMNLLNLATGRTSHSM